jgi:hypothetical protein
MDKQAALEMVKNGGKFYSLPKELQNDKDVVLAAVKNDGFNLEYVSDKEFLNDKEVVLESVKSSGSSLQFASTELQNDKEVVLEAVKNFGPSLQFASKELQKDKEVVLMSAKNAVHGLVYADRELFKDKDVFLAGMKIRACDIRDATKELQNDKEVALFAVKKNGNNLKYASKSLQNDKDLVLEAVKNNGESIEFASEQLQNDKEVALESVKNNGKALKFISKYLQNDKEIVIAAIKNFGYSLEFASYEQQNNRDVVLMALNQDPLSIKYASKELQNDKNIVLIAVKMNGRLLQYASTELKNDREVVLESLKGFPQSFEFASEELLKDRDLYHFAIRNIFKFKSDDFKSELVNKIVESKSTLATLINCKAYYVFLEFTELFSMVHEEKDFKIPNELRHLIGMKLKDNGSQVHHCIKIFEHGISLGESFSVYQECCFELGKIYSIGKEKNFDKSEEYLNKCIFSGFKVKESTSLLNQLQKYTKNLNQDEKSTFEQCSNADSYEISKYFAHSSDAHLYLVKRIIDGQEFVLKKFEVDDTKDSFNTSLKEVLFLKKLKHELICEVVDFYIKEEEVDEEFKYFFCIIMPKYSQDLSKFIKINKKDIEQFNGFIIDICYGIHFIHSQNVIHRDLKPGKLNQFSE